MGQAIDKKETVDLRKLLTSIIIQERALVNLLDRKGIVSKQELLEEIKKVRASMPKLSKSELDFTNSVKIKEYFLYSCFSNLAPTYYITIRNCRR